MLKATMKGEIDDSQYRRVFKTWSGWRMVSSVVQPSSVLALQLSDKHQAKP